MSFMELVKNQKTRLIALKAEESVVTPAFDCQNLKVGIHTLEKM